MEFFRGQLRKTVFLMEKHVFVFCFFYVILQNIKKCVGVKALRMQFLNPFGFSLFSTFW